MSEKDIQYRWISLQEVCNYLGVKRHTVLRWIDKDEPPMSGRLYNEQN